MPPPKTLSKEKDDLLGKLCWHRAVSCAGATWPVVSVKGECSTCNWVTQSGTRHEWHEGGVSLCHEWGSGRRFLTEVTQWLRGCQMCQRQEIQ